ncbi:UNVERIFIED_CONTAM: hypothetical protein HDU68_005072 [Siphonaria sp. JEL0065]|nr:hypothetical protein HDU68_005072 [Siphonaria sp. JEL0065]
MSLPRSNSNRGSNRFQTSPFRNVELKEGHRDTFTVLPNETGPAVDAGPWPLAVGTGNTVYARTSANGLSASSGLSVNVGVGVHSLETSVYQATQHVVAGCGDGTVRVFNSQLASESATSTKVAGSNVAVSALAVSPVAFAGAVSTEERISLVDLSARRVVAAFSNGSSFAQSLAWSQCGSLLATTARDHIVRLFDARASTLPIASTSAVHAGVKAAKVLWLGNSLDHMLLTTGFSKTRDRECGLWDSRSLREPVLIHKVDSTTGSLIPLYDADSNLLFLTGKGDTTIRTFEVNASTLMQTPTSFVASRPINNAVLAKKSSLNIMDCEVARITALSTGGSYGESLLTPISATIARKSKIDFQSDLFPDTIEECATLTGVQWIQGENAPLVKVSLDPNSPTRRTIQSLKLVSEAVPFQEPPPERPSTPSGRSTPVYGSGGNGNRNSIGPSALSTSFTASDVVKEKDIVSSPVAATAALGRKTPPAIRPKSINLANVVPVASIPDPIEIIKPEQHQQPAINTAALEATISQLLDTKFATLLSHISLLQSPSPPLTPPTTTEEPNETAEKLDLVFQKLEHLNTRMTTFETQLSTLQDQIAVSHVLLNRQDQDRDEQRVQEAKDQKVLVEYISDCMEKVVDANKSAVEEASRNLSEEVLDTLAGHFEGIKRQVKEVKEVVVGVREESRRGSEHVKNWAAALDAKVDGWPESLKDTLDLGLAKQTTSLVGLMDDIIKEQAEAIYAASSVEVAGGKENKRNSYRLPTVPNMGIMNQVSKLKDLALNARPGSSLAGAVGDVGDVHRSMSPESGADGSEEVNGTVHNA